MTGDSFYFILGIVAINFSIMLPLLVFQHLQSRKIKFELMNTNQMIRELMLSSNLHEAKYKTINAQLSLIGSKIAPENYKKLQKKLDPSPRSIKKDLATNQGKPAFCNSGN